jgi:hypothetical protein
MQQWSVASGQCAVGADAQGEVAVAGEAGFAEGELRGVEVVGLQTLAEEAWVEGFPRPVVVKDRGERWQARRGHGPGAAVGSEVFGGEHGGGRGAAARCLPRWPLLSFQ